MLQPNHTWRMQSLCRLLRLVLAAIEEVATKGEIDCMPRARWEECRQQLAFKAEPDSCENPVVTPEDIGVLAELIKKLPASTWFCDVGEA